MSIIKVALALAGFAVLACSGHTHGATPPTPHASSRASDSLIVDKPPARISCPLPAYPAAGSPRAGTDSVELEFVVDQQGRAETSSIKALFATDTLFVEPAAAALRQCLFRPGFKGSQAVRTLSAVWFRFRRSP